MELSPFSRHLISLRSKYPPQHPVLKEVFIDLISNFSWVYVSPLHNEALI
jgi:hypothetical protein